MIKLLFSCTNQDDLLILKTLFFFFKTRSIKNINIFFYELRIMPFLHSPILFECNHITYMDRPTEVFFILFIIIIIIICLFVSEHVYVQVFEIVDHIFHWFYIQKQLKRLLWCCDVAVAQINYPSLKHNTQDSIEQVRGRSHEESSSPIFMLDDMQFWGGFGHYLG